MAGLFEAFQDYRALTGFIEPNIMYSLTRIYELEYDAVSLHDATL
jgi:hypothetical protein